MEVNNIINQVIGVGLSALIVGGLNAYLNRSTHQKIDSSTNTANVLSLNNFYKIIGWIGMTMTIIFIVGMVYISITEEWNLAGFIILIVATLLIGYISFLTLSWYYFYRVSFDSEYIIVTDRKGESQTIAWKDIDQIRFRHTQGYIKIEANGKVIKIHQHLVGLQSFLIEMEKQTPWRIKDLHLPMA